MIYLAAFLFIAAVMIAATMIEERLHNGPRLHPRYPRKEAPNFIPEFNINLSTKG